jgi:transposase
MEASGRYHMPLANLAHEMGFRVVVANPRRVSAFVRSTRSRGKTDRTDARSLAQYVQSQSDALRDYSPAPDHASRVRDLVRERQALVDAKASLEQSLVHSPQVLEVACEGINQAIASLDKQLKACLSKIREYQLICEIPGVGPVVAASLVALLMSYDFVSADSFVAYLGMDPKPSDSGAHKGKRHVSGQGDATARRLAFMAGMTGMRTSAWKEYAQKQKGKGLSGTETALIVGRKIVRTAWSIYTHKQPFDPKRISQRP